MYKYIHTYIHTLELNEIKVNKIKMAGSSIFNRKQSEKMTNEPLIDFTVKLQDELI